MKLDKQTLLDMGAIERDDSSWQIVTGNSPLVLHPIRNDDGSPSSNSTEEGYWLLFDVVVGNIRNIVETAYLHGKYDGERALQGKLQALLGVEGR